MVIGYPRWLDAQDKQSVHGKRTPERRQAGDSIPQPSAFTIGGMALVQCLKGDQRKTTKFLMKVEPVTGLMSYLMITERNP